MIDNDVLNQTLNIDHEKNKEPRKKLVRVNFSTEALPSNKLIKSKTLISSNTLNG